MKSFSYKIKDEIGIHARPAGLLVKQAKQFESDINIKLNNNEANGKKLMALMGLNVKCGDTIEVEISGADEEKAAECMKAFFESNL